MPIALVVLTLLPLFLYQDRLPDPLATHWGTTGRPNDTMSFNFLVVFELVLVTVPCSGLAWAARRDPAHHGQITRLVAVLTFIATTVAVTSWRVVTANLDVADWTQADAVGVIDVLSALAIRVRHWRFRRASMLEVMPMEHGGWGYRGSLRFFGRAPIVLRAGDGLQLDLADEKVLTITVDHAEEGAGLLNDLVSASTI